MAQPEQHPERQEVQAQQPLKSPDEVARLAAQVEALQQRLTAAERRGVVEGLEHDHDRAVDAVSRWFGDVADSYRDLGRMIGITADEAGQAVRDEVAEVTKQLAVAKQKLAAAKDRAVQAIKESPVTQTVVGMSAAAAEAVGKAHEAAVNGVVSVLEAGRLHLVDIPREYWTDVAVATARKAGQTHDQAVAWAERTIADSVDANQYLIRVGDQWIDATADGAVQGLASAAEALARGTKRVARKAERAARTVAETAVGMASTVAQKIDQAHEAAVNGLIDGTTAANLHLINIPQQYWTEVAVDTVGGVTGTHEKAVAWAEGKIAETVDANQYLIKIGDQWVDARVVDAKEALARAAEQAVAFQQKMQSRGREVLGTQEEQPATMAAGEAEPPNEGGQEAAASEVEKNREQDPNNYYIAQRGDTMVSIAKKFYGDPAAWRELWLLVHDEDQKLIGGDPNKPLVRPGMKIPLPQRIAGNLVRKDRHNVA